MWSVEGIDEEKNPFDLTVVLKTARTTGAAASASCLEHYRVHSKTLCEHSGFFSRLLKNKRGREATKDQIEIEFDHQHVSRNFQTILNFMYSGKLPNYESDDDNEDKEDDTYGSDDDNRVSLAHAANLLLMDGLLQAILEQLKSDGVKTHYSNFISWKKASEFGLEDIKKQMFRNILETTANYGDGMFWSCSDELSTPEKVEVFDAALTFMDTLTEDEIRSITDGGSYLCVLSQMIFHTFVQQIPNDSVTKPIFDKIFKSPKAVSLRAIEEYIEPYGCPHEPIVLLNMHNKFYPSQIPLGQFKLTACEAWLVTLIKPPTEEPLSVEQADEILEEMSKLPIRVQTISHLVKAVGYLEIEDFVIDEEKEKFARDFPWLSRVNQDEDSETSDSDDDDDEEEDD